MDAAWVVRAGILAEIVSFFLISPEILGKERLKGAEEALRKGLANPAIDIGANLAWVALIAVAWGVTGLLIGLVTSLVVPDLSLAILPIWMGALVVSILADFRCRLAVRPFIPEEEARAGELRIVRRGYALVNLMILNPLRFARIRPSAFVWLCWLIGFPTQLFDFVAYSILPAVPLAFVHLQQRLLTGQDALRRLVFGVGVLLLLGGLAAQFFATF
jgi:hypothetical protein